MTDLRCDSAVTKKTPFRPLMLWPNKGVTFTILTAEGLWLQDTQKEREREKYIKNTNHSVTSWQELSNTLSAPGDQYIPQMFIQREQSGILSQHFRDSSVYMCACRVCAAQEENALATMLTHTKMFMKS